MRERPSTGLGLFRIMLAAAVGLHMFPSLFEMGDNYLSTAFVTQNRSFFPDGILSFAAGLPDGVVIAAAVFFTVFWFLFLIGFFSQASAIAMTAGCYFFYARNSLHIGTLSYDILLVTLFLMCVTGYHGDHLSVDAARRGRRGKPAPLRPIFLQRLLQLQLAQTFFFTAMSKITAGGNWLTDNPYFYLMRSSEMSVVKDFPFREFLAARPELCYGLGVALIVFEFILPVLWFVSRTRIISIPLGILFQWMLLVTLHVPSLFFFHFPPQMLLFISPETLDRWVHNISRRTGPFRILKPA